MSDEKFNLNVFDEEIESCCNITKTGFFRNGKCESSKEDIGLHTVCAVVTNEFLNFSKEQGNDLITPVPQYNFSGFVNFDGAIMRIATTRKEQYCKIFIIAIRNQSPRGIIWSAVPLPRFIQFLG